MRTRFKSTATWNLDTSSCCVRYVRVWESSKNVFIISCNLPALHFCHCFTAVAQSSSYICFSHCLLSSEMCKNDIHFEFFSPSKNNDAVTSEMFLETNLTCRFCLHQNLASSQNILKMSYEECFSENTITFSGIKPKRRVSVITVLFK